LPSTLQNKELTIKIVQATRKGISPSMLANMRHMIEKNKKKKQNKKRNSSKAWCRCNYEEIFAVENFASDMYESSS